MLCLQRQENHIYLDKGLRDDKMHHFLVKSLKSLKIYIINTQMCST